MSNYEQKLDQFAKGKRLLRLPRPIRDRADASCDACGSSQPRTLYALKDLESDCYYFLGDTCLKETVKRGSVLRRYGKEPGPQAFNSEKERRSAESVEEKRSSVPVDELPPIGSEPPEPRKESVAGSAASPGEPFLFPVVLILEAPQHYQAVISLVSARGMLHGWGKAEEPRYQACWRIGVENGGILEQVQEERPDALELCLARAWQEALAGRHEATLPWTADVGSHPGPAAVGRADPGLSYLQLAAAALGKSTSGNGNGGI